MTFKRLLTYLKPYKKQLLIISLTITLSSICTILTPLLTGKFITNITKINNLNINILKNILIFISIFYLINTLSMLIENYYMNTISEKIIINIKNEANKKLSSLKTSYYDKNKSGELITKINSDIYSLSYLFTQLIPKIITYAITLIGTIIIMFTINITLALITLLLTPLTIILSKYIIKLSKKKYQQFYAKQGALNSIIEESYTTKEIISLHNNDKLIVQNFKNLNKDLAKTNLKASIITNLINPLSSIINYSIYFTIIIIGSNLVLANKMSLGNIYSFIQYSKQLGTPINGFSSLLTNIQNSLASAERIFSLLDEEEQTHNGKQKLETINKIEFKNVTFAYTDTPTLKNINFNINKGEKVAIIGETGSGKSTIINLLMQFYNINEGNILINNKSIYDYSIESYYNNISLITQDILLINDTIENNLKLGKFDATEEEIVNACKTTNSFNFIKNLPSNFKELIKDEKENLSKGEKQLLTITRAIIKDYNLLILDEATSNIDSKNEKNIQNFIENLPQDKTAIIIAHKLSTITKADKIIVLKNGEIKEIGTPSSLYKEKGEYYSLLQSL